MSFLHWIYIVIVVRASADTDVSKCPSWKGRAQCEVPAPGEILYCGRQDDGIRMLEIRGDNLLWELRCEAADLPRLRTIRLPARTTLRCLDILDTFPAARVFIGASECPKSSTPAATTTTTGNSTIRWPARPFRPRPGHMDVRRHVHDTHIYMVRRRRGVSRRERSSSVAETSLVDAHRGAQQRTPETFGMTEATIEMSPMVPDSPRKRRKFATPSRLSGSEDTLFDFTTVKFD